MLKSITITLTLVLVAFLSSAQNFVFSTDQHVSGLFDNGIELDIKFKTPTPEAITYKYVTVKHDIPEDWSFTICDYKSCHVTIKDSTTMQNITQAEAEAGTEGFFKFSVISAETGGEHGVTYYVYDANDPTRGDTVSFSMYYRTASIEKPGISSLSTFPNPANQQITIRDVKQNSIIEVIDVNGRLIEKIENQTHGTLHLPTSDWENGIYTIKQISAEEIAASRVVIQH